MKLRSIEPTFCGTLNKFKNNIVYLKEFSGFIIGSEKQMSQKDLSDLNELLEGITLKIGEFTDAIKGSSTQLDGFSKTIDSKIVSLNKNISALTKVIQEEDKKLSKNLRSIVGELKGEIKSFKEEVKISDIQDTLSALKKLIKIPEKPVINQTVDKIMKEVSEIVKDLKGSK